MAIDLYFGVRDFTKYAVGDAYPLTLKELEGGICDGEGYSECAVCEKDFFLIVYTQAGKITGAHVDPNQAGYIPD